MQAEITDCWCILLDGYALEPDTVAPQKSETRGLRLLRCHCPPSIWVDAWVPFWRTRPAIEPGTLSEESWRLRSCDWLLRPPILSLTAAWIEIYSASLTLSALIKDLLRGCCFGVEGGVGD